MLGKRVRSNALELNSGFPPVIRRELRWNLVCPPRVAFHGLAKGHGLDSLMLVWMKSAHA